MGIESATQIFDISEWRRDSDGNYTNIAGLTNVHGGTQRATAEQIRGLQTVANGIANGTDSFEDIAAAQNDFYNWEDSGLGDHYAGKAGDIDNLSPAEQRAAMYSLVFAPTTSRGGWGGMNNFERILALGGLTLGGFAIAGALGAGPLAGAMGGSSSAAAAPATNALGAPITSTATPMTTSGVAASDALLGVGGTAVPGAVGPPVALANAGVPGAVAGANVVNTGVGGSGAANVVTDYGGEVMSPGANQGTDVYGQQGTDVSGGGPPGGPTGNYVPGGTQDFDMGGTPGGIEVPDGTGTGVDPNAEPFGPPTPGGGVPGSADDVMPPGDTGGMPDWLNMPEDWDDFFGRYILPGIQGYLDYNAQSDAADAYLESNQQSLDEIKRQYDQDRADLEPWRNIGSQAINTLGAESGYGPDGQPIPTEDRHSSFYSSPGYEWRRGEGQRDIGNAFSASGGAKSGNALKALTEWNQGLASEEYGNWRAGEERMAGIGLNATNTGVMAGQNSSSNTANLLGQRGDARVSGILGRYGAQNRTINNWADNYFARNG